MQHKLSMFCEDCKSVLAEITIQSDLLSKDELTAAARFIRDHHKANAHGWQIPDGQYDYEQIAYPLAAEIDALEEKCAHLTAELRRAGAKDNV